MRDGLWLFFALTFGWTWGVGALYAVFPDELVAVFGAPSGTNPVFLLAVGAPTLMSLLVAGLVSGRSGLNDLGTRLGRWRAAWFWYALATFGVAALALGARMCSAAVSSFTFVGLFEQARWPALIGAGLVTFVTDPGPLAEELGWRGFALPRLEQRWSGIVSALVLGAVWGVWHLPAFFIPGLPQSSFPVWTFMVSSMALSVLMAWVVNNAGGSVVVAILMHWAFNRSAALDVANAIYTAAFFTAAAVLVTLITGPSLGAERMVAPPSKRLL